MNSLNGNFERILDAAQNTITFLATGYCRQHGINPTDIATIIMRYFGCKLKFHIAGPWARAYCLNPRDKSTIEPELRQIDGTDVVEFEELSQFINGESADRQHLLIGVKNKYDIRRRHLTQLKIKSMSIMDDSNYIVAMITNDNDIYFIQLGRKSHANHIWNTHRARITPIHNNMTQHWGDVFFLGDYNHGNRSNSATKNIVEQLHKHKVLRSNIIDDIKILINDENIEILNVELSRSKQRRITDMFIICDCVRKNKNKKNENRIASPRTFFRQFKRQSEILNKNAELIVKNQEKLTESLIINDDEDDNSSLDSSNETGIQENVIKENKENKESKETKDKDKEYETQNVNGNERFQMIFNVNVSTFDVQEVVPKWRGKVVDVICCDARGFFLIENGQVYIVQMRIRENGAIESLHEYISIW